MNIVTPDQIVAELRQIADMADNGPETVRDAEVRFDQAFMAWQKEWDVRYAQAQGTVADREIQARGFTTSEKTRLDIAKAALNYAKATVRQLESKQSNLQTQLRAVQIAMGQTR